MSIASNSVDLSLNAVLHDCAAALKKVAEYQLPPPIDRRLLWLSENKDVLSETEREELLALVDFADARTAEKLQAQAALLKMSQVIPPTAARP